jgi:hypothetical protein
LLELITAGMLIGLALAIIELIIMLLLTIIDVGAAGAADDGAAAEETDAAAADVGAELDLGELSCGAVPIGTTTPP